MGRNYNRLRRLCAFIIGAVFFVSGLLKLLDPVGAGLVMAEYFRFFGTDFMLQAAKPAAEAMSIFETLLGALLMTGLWRKVVAVTALVFICGFTILTVILVIFNPDMDCGCFGEAVHLSHMQSLVKNLVLCALSAVAFTPINCLGRPKRRKYVSFGIVAASVAVFAVYSLMYIPMVDFTDFRAASRLAASAGEVSGTYEASFVYEKDGMEKIFSLENLPDSTWTFVRTETVQSGGTGETYPTLSFTDADGRYCDNLAASGKVIVISVYDPGSVPGRRWEEIAGRLPEIFGAGYHPIILVAGDSFSLASALAGTVPEDIAGNIAGSAYFADYKTLMTLNRSNGGAVYFHDGYLVRKWSFRNLPSSDELDRIALDYVDETVIETTTAGHLAFQAFLLLSFAVILFV